MKTVLITFLLMPPLLSVAQKTKVEGIVMDGLFGEPLPFAKVQFQNSKIGVYTDSVGHYMLESYYATDSLVFTFTGYIKSTVFISKDQSQEVNITLNVLQSDVAAVFVRPLDELPSTRLHKRIIANKPINNKEKLASYEYE
ncbi:carboxypeptidase-like regulatory domain-containing protein, partial [Crocinitomicaceae bacterium]|nr:carboxypeptidase-like regulatory domain-containing protein [Crocinitomicaceae bacterium]